MTRLLNTTTTDPAKIEAETKRIDAISWELHNRKATDMKTETIARGIEVIQDEQNNVYVNLNGHVLNFPWSFEDAAQWLAEVHAKGRQCLYGSDPLYYVNNYCMKG